MTDELAAREHARRMAEIFGLEPQAVHVLALRFGIGLVLLFWLGEP